MMELKEKLPELINAAIPGASAEISDFRGELTLTVRKEKIVDIAKMLKSHDDLQFVICEDVTAIDWATRKIRFSVVYHLFSLALKSRLRLVANLDDHKEEIESVASVWKSADWYERETFDMFGITFLNHPDLRRMYMPEEFEYHPLRKEFPLLGIPGSIPLPKK